MSTTLVGFASTTYDETSNNIKSLQAVYYTKDPVVCSCLSKSPTLGGKTEVAPEPFSATDFVGRILTDPEFASLAFKWTVSLFVISVVLITFIFIMICLATWRGSDVYLNK